MKGIARKSRACPGDFLVVHLLIYSALTVTDIANCGYQPLNHSDLGYLKGLYSLHFRLLISANFIKLGNVWWHQIELTIKKWCLWILLKWLVSEDAEYLIKTSLFQYKITHKYHLGTWKTVTITDVPTVNFQENCLSLDPFWATMVASLWLFKSNNSELGSKSWYKIWLFGKYIAYLLKMLWQHGFIQLTGWQDQNYGQGKIY